MSGFGDGLNTLECEDMLILANKVDGRDLTLRNVPPEDG